MYRQELERELRMPPGEFVPVMRLRGVVPAQDEHRGLRPTAASRIRPLALGWVETADVPIEDLHGE